MRINNSIFFLSLLFLVINYGRSAAQEKNNVPLADVLNVLENRFGVVFSYSDENIKGIIIEIPPENLTLAKTLLILEGSTGLKFNKVNNRFITIYKARLSNNQFCGFIKDKETKKAIIGGVIYANGKYAISDKSGYFQLEFDPKADSVIYIQQVGYLSLKINQGKWTNECTSIYLVQETVKLKEVIITNYLTKGINKIVDGSLQLNVQDVNMLPGLTEPDVLYTLQALPGIQSINETVSNINIRGGTNDQNLLLWDGVKMYQSGHFFGLISAINPYFAEKTTLIKNGTSAFWGDGVSGTIDTRSADRVTSNFEGNVGLNLINADAQFKIPLNNKASIHLGARKSISGFIETPTYKQYFNRAFRDTEITNPSSTIDTLVNSNENFSYFDLNLKFLYDISSKDKLRIGLFTFSNAIDYEESELVNGAIETKISGLNKHNLILHFNYNRLWNKNIKTSAFGYLSQYKLDALNFDILNAQRLIQENEVTDIGLKLDALYAINSNLDLFSGYQLSGVTIINHQNINNPDFELVTKNTLLTHSLFSEVHFVSNARKTNMRLGLRVNYFDKFGRLIFEPRLTFTQKFLNHFSFEVLAETKNQTTVQIIDSQNDFLGLENRRWILSNEEDVPIIESKQVSMGINYKRNNLLISVDGYYKNVNGIISSSQGFQNQFEYMRTAGNYNVAGIDVLINKRFSSANTWLNYSFADNQYFFNDFSPSSFPNNLDVAHTLSIGMSYTLAQFEFSTGFNYRTGKPYTQPLNVNSIVDGKIIYKSPNSSQIEDYSRLDLSVNYKFNLSSKIKSLVGLSVWNVLNTKNIVNINYRINESDEIGQVKHEALSIVPNINFRIFF